DDLAADVGRGARTVVDQDLLSERGPHGLGDRARDDVRAATGRIRHDPANRLVRPGLRQGPGAGKRRCRPGEEVSPLHCSYCGGCCESCGPATRWSIAPKMLWPSLPFISMRIVSPKRMNSVD